MGYKQKVKSVIMLMGAEVINHTHCGGRRRQ